MLLFKNKLIGNLYKQLLTLFESTYRAADSFPSCFQDTEAPLLSEKRVNREGISMAVSLVRSGSREWWYGSSRNMRDELLINIVIFDKRNEY